MKKLMILGVSGVIFLFMLIMVCVAGFMGSEAGSVASPLPVFANEEEAYAYQYIGSELGVPWDIVMLVDGIQAYAEGDGSLKENPLLTSLEFCILQEEQFVLEYIEVEKEEDESEETDEDLSEGNKSDEGDIENPENESKEEEKEDSKTEWIPVWEPGEVKTYTGCDAILAYIDKNRETVRLNYKDASGIVAEINATAEEKGIDDDVRYEVVLFNNPNYEGVLKDFVGLSEEHVSYVMQLYDAGYLSELYGYKGAVGDVELPDIIVGSVTREEFARVAVSIMGHPYLMGGKSSVQGAPTGPLDCSGYVDWVYVQCFGVTVGSGTVPEGVAASGTAIQWYASEFIKDSELKVGDLGFARDPAMVKSGQVNHVGIYLGEHRGKDYWIHCGGSAYGTVETPKGRVGISLASGLNTYNPVDGSEFAPAMNGCKFRYFRRPRFEFVED